MIEMWVYRLLNPLQNMPNPLRLSTTFLYFVLNGVKLGFNGEATTGGNQRVLPETRINRREGQREGANGEDDARRAFSRCQDRSHSALEQVSG